MTCMKQGKEAAGGRGVHGIWQLGRAMMKAGSTKQSHGYMRQVLSVHTDHPCFYRVQDCQSATDMPDSTPG